MDKDNVKDLLFFSLCLNGKIKNLNIILFSEFFIYLSGLAFDLIIIFLLKINPNNIAVIFD